MKKTKWKLTLGIFLLGLSMILYFFHYIVFKDLHHIFIYMVGDIAFVPIEVLLVTLIIHQVLERREKRSRLQKMNMVIGVFFIEVGTQLLKLCFHHDAGLEELHRHFIVTGQWKEKDFTLAKKTAKEFPFRIESRKASLSDLKDFLIQKRDFLLGLLENANLLEHESFSDLLWAVSHLNEELMSRKDTTSLHKNDFDHLSGDIKRVYVLLIRKWLDYMQHLKKSYPYLFSLAVRTNPFDPEANPEIG